MTEKIVQASSEKDAGKNPVIRVESFFNAASGEGEISYRIWRCEGIEAKAIVQIAHGMAEHSERYDHFASHLASNGYVVCANDHAGHGKSENGCSGFFAPKDGWKYVIEDVKRLMDIVAEKYKLPCILLGHSMGSFIARCFAAEYGSELKGMILSGTGGPNSLAKLGLALANAQIALRGQKSQGKLLDKIAFGKANEKIKSPTTEKDWLSCDESVVQAYCDDPACGFLFTASGFRDLLKWQITASLMETMRKYPKDLPILIIGGGQDFVGDYGKGSRTVSAMLKEAGIQDVQLKLYENGRHEMLNELNRSEVYSGVLGWLDSHLA